MNTSSIVSKVWSFCHTLRDDGVGYGDYLEQLTYLIFLKMADEYAKPPYNRNIGVPSAYDWQSLKSNLARAFDSRLARAMVKELDEIPEKAVLVLVVARDIDDLGEGLVIGINTWAMRLFVLHQRCRELSYERLHEERVVARSNVHLNSNRIELGCNNGPDRRNDDAFEALPQFRFSTEGACDVAEPSNLGRACEGDRVDLAGSHFGNDSNHARVVDFRSIDIWKHGIRFRPGAFEEFQKSLIRIAGI